MPVIYGMRPILALVSYVVPAALDSDSVLVGITMKARGSGSEHFLRKDAVTMGLSERLKDAETQVYLAALSSMYTKRSIDELVGALGSGSALLTVSALPGSPRDLRITFNGPGDGGLTSIAIYDESGSPIFSPYSSNTGRNAMETSYRVPASGAYFVTLAHNGRIVKTSKIIIAQ